MDKHLKTKWLAALRSNQYAQTKYQLVRERNKGEYAYCCLGVLCEVAGLEKSNDREHLNHFISKAGYHAEASLPTDLREKAKITLEQQRELTALNDAKGYTFPEIATYIEENM